jgi:metal-responsive CopG/Arc/MetJ family transcriptional regulator
MRDVFIPKSNDENKKVISIRLDLRHLDKIDKIAAKNYLSRNQCINQMLEFVLERLSDDDIINIK